MKTNVMVAVAAAVALCGCQSANKEASTASVGGNDSGGSPVTLVGCLVPGAAGAQSGTVGTSGNAAESGFTLIDATTTSTPMGADTNAAPNSPATPATPGTSGTAGTSSTPAAGTAASGGVDTGTPKSYGLIPDKTEKDLQKYQNSQVEVRGMLVASTDTGTGVPDVGAASTPAGTPPTNVQHVRVDHVRQLNKSCNGSNPNRKP